MSVISNVPVEINGVAHSWANLIANIAGVEVTGITAIEYSDSEAIENVYGLGQFPVARAYGKITSTASVTLLSNEVDAICKAVPSGRLQDIPPFDIIVQFTDGEKAITTHRIRNAQFKGNKMSAQQSDDTAIKTTLELIVSHIEWK